MAIIRRVNQLSQMREECSDLRAIESAASADFDLLAESFISGAGNPYIINGFAINMASNPIGGAASNLQVVVANGALLHTTASQSGTFFLVPAGTPNVVLECGYNF
jgi:phage-related protein